MAASPKLRKTLDVDIEGLNLLTGVLLEKIADTDGLEGVKQLANQLHEETNERLNLMQEIEGGQRSIKQYKMFLILDYIKKQGGIEKSNRVEMMAYADIRNYDVMYAYIGEMIEEGLIDFDMRAWSKNAGSYMKD